MKVQHTATSFAHDGCTWGAYWILVNSSSDASLLLEGISTNQFLSRSILSWVCHREGVGFFFHDIASCSAEPPQ